MSRIKLHNNAITMFPQLSLTENRVLLTAIEDIESSHEFGDKVFTEINLASIMERCKLTYVKEAFDVALQAVQVLKSQDIRFDLPNKGVLVTQAIFEYKYYEDEYTIYVHWNAEILPLIKGFMEKGSFFFLNAQHTRIASNRRLCLVALLLTKVWKIRKEGSFQLFKSEIRSILNLLPGEYKEFKQIKARYIKPAIEEIYRLEDILLEAKIKANVVEFKEVENVA